MSHPSPLQPPPFSTQPLAAPSRKTVGIVAGAEDAKYQQKYQDLKRKVKEIEADNDKLQYKVLVAKRGVQRMKLERAILYERLSAVPPSPEHHDRLPLPVVQGPSGSHRREPIPVGHVSRDARSFRDERERDMREFRDTRGSRETHQDVRDMRRNSRDMWDPRDHNGPSHGALQGQPAGYPPMNTLPPVRTSRRDSIGSHEPSRQHLPTLPPLHHLDTPPLMHRNSPLLHRSSHEHPQEQQRSRGQPASYNHANQPLYPPPLENKQQNAISPLLSDRERSDRPSRRHDINELAPNSRDSHHSRAHHSPVPLSPRRVQSHHRGYHNGAADEQDKRERERDRNNGRERIQDRDREERYLEEPNRAREREIVHNVHSPPLHRSHPESYTPQQHRRDSYYADGPSYPARSGSESPPSASASGSGRTPDEPSREHHYENSGPSQPRSYRLRPVAQTEIMDFVHEDGRSYLGRDRRPAPEHHATRPTSESARKRSRIEMEEDVDMDRDHEESSSAVYNSAQHLSDDRLSKRLHQETGSKSGTH